MTAKTKLKLTERPAAGAQVTYTDSMGHRVPATVGSAQHDTPGWININLAGGVTTWAPLSDLTGTAD